MDKPRGRADVEVETPPSAETNVLSQSSEGTQDAYQISGSSLRSKKVSLINPHMKQTVWR